MLCDSYSSLNFPTKLNDCNNSFWWLYHEFKRLLLICQYFTKRVEKLLILQPSCWRGQLCFRVVKKQQIIWQTKTGYIIISGKFSEMVTCTKKGQFAFGYGYKVMMEVRFYFNQELQSNISWCIFEILKVYI